MALLTNETITVTKKETLPDGRVRTTTETTIDTERTAAIARVWMVTGFRFMMSIQLWLLLATVLLVAGVGFGLYHKFGHVTKPGYYAYLAGTPGRNCELHVGADGSRGFHCYGRGYERITQGTVKAVSGSGENVPFNLTDTPIAVHGRVRSKGRSNR